MMTNIAHELFLLTTNLSQFNSKVLIKKVFVESLNTIFPDHNFFLNKEIDETSEDMLKVCTSKNTYGSISFSNRSAFTEESFSLFQNAVQWLAILFEKLDQEALLNDQKKHLHSLVEEKTKDLVESQTQYKNLFENSIHEVHYWRVIKDKNDKIKTWELVAANPSALKAWNKTQEQVIGKTTNEIFNDDARKLFMPIVEKIFKTGKPLRWEKFFPATKQYLSMDSIPIGEFFISIGRDITIKRKEEQELQEEKEKANSRLQQIKIIQANTPNITWKWDFDKDGNYTNVYISEVADKFLALPEGSIDNSLDKFFSYILPEFLPLINNTIKNAIDHPNKVFSLEYEVKREDGKLIWLSSSGKVIPENEKLTIYGSTVDITEKKQNEQKLLQSDRVFNLSLDMFCIAGFDGYFKYLNPAWERTLGWTIEELLSKPWLDFVHPDDAEKTENVKSVIVDGKEIYQFENRYICKNGSVVWLSWNSQPFPDENIMIGAVRDVTESKIIENELLQAKERAEKSETRFKALHNASFGGITIHDKGLILECNNGLTEITGFTRDELVGMDGLLLIAEESRKKVRKKIKEAFEEPYEAIGIRKNGEKYPLRLEAREIPYKGKNVRVVEFRDVTEQKEVELALIKTKEKAEESDRLKSAFLATMSHELRTPLNSIIGFSDLINENTPIEDAVQFSKTVNSSGSHLLNIVEDLFDITLIEAGQLKTENQTVDLFAALHEVKEIIKNEQINLGKSQLDLSLKIPAKTEKISLSTDESKFKQLLINLLKNALKFTHEGHVHFGFEIETNKNRLKFYVEDTGIGIPKDKQELIFDVFRQVDETYTKNYGGTGIGLSLSKKIVEMLGGEIWVDSKENKGSTFYFTIPYEGIKDAIQNKESDIKKSKTRNKKYNNKKVLVAEDDDSSYDFLYVLLKKQGINILRAENGVEAISLCKDDASINLVLMDINMPVMNGYEATKKIKKFKPDLPIIAQTAYAIEGDKEKSLKAGCDDYISKPIKKEKLKTLIQKYL